MATSRRRRPLQPRAAVAHFVQAALRDTRVVLHEARWPLILFGAVWLGFTLILWRWYRPDGTVPAFAVAAYTAMEQLLFQPQTLPTEPALQLLFFLAPAVGLSLVATGALNAAVLLFDKRTRREAWQMALASTYTNHIIVCGLGKVGYRVVGQLRSAGQEVVVIQRNPQNEFFELTVGMGVPVIVGDARQADMLLQAGLLRAHSVTIVTNDDLTNLDIALTARELRPDVQIVMRVFNDALARKLASAFNIKTAFSTSALAAPTFAAAAINREVQNAIYVGGQFLVTQELKVTAGGVLDNQTVGAIEQGNDVSILYRRNASGEDLRPKTEERLNAGDVIVLIGVLATLERLARLNS